MSLDVYVNYPHAEHHKGPPRLKIEDDGSFWFLHPFLEELSETSGQVVDLYGDAHFEGTSLAAFTASLQKARTALASKPSRWVFREAVFDKRGGGLREYAAKEEVSRLLDGLTRLADDATVGGGRLDFVGD